MTQFTYSQYTNDNFCCAMFNYDLMRYNRAYQVCIYNYYHAELKKISIELHGKVVEQFRCFSDELRHFEKPAHRERARKIKL